ncbi:MAG: FlgD immunoglobulin-like domain containing protein [bacterium]|nr:FlgD immunoglobulin-like domain containing protein [bacterium]
MKHSLVCLVVVLTTARSWSTTVIKGNYKTPFNYAIVVKNSTLEDSSWSAVADTLQARHGGTIFTHTGNVWDVQSSLSEYKPTHICFLAKVTDITSVGSTEYVRRIHQLTRALDDDPYGDAVWGILTGYNADDAMKIATTPKEVLISNVLLKDCMGLLYWVRQGMYFACHIYGRVGVKRPDCDTVEVYNNGPQDCTDTMVTLINTNTFHLIMPGGHGDHDAWQLHYPSPGYEGYFRSSNGQVYGDPYSGSNINVSSTNPKVFFAPFNCLHGQILGGGSFVPSWAHTGGVCQYWGNTIPVGTPAIMKGFYYVWYQPDRNTFAEAFYYENQSVIFNIVNNIPGSNQSGLNTEKDVWGFYGDPGCDFRFEKAAIEPWSEYEFIIKEGTGGVDTVTFRITVTREGKPGAWPWGQPEIALLPFIAEDVHIISTDAYNAVVTENFVLLDIWHQGDSNLQPGATREVVFTAKKMGVEESHISVTKFVILSQNCPNPFTNVTTIPYYFSNATRTPSPVSLKIYSISGNLVKVLVAGYQSPGSHNVSWDGCDNFGNKVPNGVYFCRLSVDNCSATKKLSILR